ncbi:hypothetical protein GPECTOR_91g557 [Gonium pectorale]|uniref:Uncharacterized protein n=1 Tax=Gonium pectorale TaxID=33097 RepID=A0A150G0J2_GONPE|nr:hypothetical protein GPECTOR_91g557 [Gonium pectorale]|eukprot:KXZ43403.1 hypothetical protein GPECTOR_91g557 [Gonium pectorale]
MIDMANDSGEGLNFGIPLIVGAFERLSLPQKYTVLEQVTRALLQPTPACPSLTAVSESAIYYVYAWLQMEFDDVEGGEYVWGAKVLAALREGAEADEPTGEDEELQAAWPSMGCLDRSRWRDALESLADRILWDRDWELEAELGAGAHQAVMERLDIEEDYYAPFTAPAARGAKDRLYDMARRISDRAPRP